MNLFSGNRFSRMLIRPFLLVFVLACLFCANALCEKTSDTGYSLAFKSINRVQIEDKIRLLEQKLSDEPDHLGALLELATSYHKLFQNDATYYKLAEEAYIEFTVALDTASDKGNAFDWNQCDRYSMGQFYLESGDYQSAIKSINKATELCPDLLHDADVINALGIGYYSQGNYEEASKYFIRALEIEPWLDVARYNLWSVKYRLFLLGYIRNITNQKYDDSDAMYQIGQLRRITPRYIDAKILEGNIHLKAGRLDEAYELYSSIISAGDGASSHLDLGFELAHILFEKGELAPAQEQLVELMAEIPESQVELRNKAGELLIKILRERESVTISNQKWPEDDLAEPASLPLVSGGHVIFNCEDCHIKDSSDNELYTCGGCHPTFINMHPLDFAPERKLPESFSLSDGGKFVCATCHRLHGGREGLSHLRFLTRTSYSRDKFCSQCHSESISKLNPHRKDQGIDKCGLCHAIQSDDVDTKRSSNDICNFCHGVLENNHPQMLYFFDEEIPIIDISQEQWTCTTCHLSHGTSGAINFLRTEVVSAIVKVQKRDPHLPIKSTCLNCHQYDNVEEIRSSWGKALRFQGDVGMLCASCHIRDSGHHPVGVALPENSLEFEVATHEVGLNRQKCIDCYTCHVNKCLSNEYRMKLRISEDGTVRNELCWKCHKKKRFITKSPHIDDRKYCLHCHETQPSKEVALFAMDVPDNVCDTCHEVGNHPGGNHLVKPSDQVDIPPAFPLGSNEQIVCFTCHNPHQVEPQAESPKNPRRLRQGVTNCRNTCHSKI